MPENSGGKPIAIRGVSKIYESRRGQPIEALTPVELEIAAGEFVVIVGPSGCGKTTLLYMLAGAGPPAAASRLARRRSPAPTSIAAWCSRATRCSRG
jgi:NitT/TauT family transport system ATP-binding protein